MALVVPATAALRVRVVPAVLRVAALGVVEPPEVVTPVVPVMFKAQVAVAVAVMRSKGLVFAPVFALTPSTSLLPQGVEEVEVGVTQQTQEQAEIPEVRVLVQLVLLYPLLAERLTL